MIPMFGSSRSSAKRLLIVCPICAGLTHDIVRYGGIEINLAERWLKVDGTLTSLTSQEWTLLIYLIRRPRIVRTTEELMLEMACEGSRRCLWVQMSHIRVALGRYRQWIKTIRGIGYAFDPELDVCLTP